MKYPAEAYSGFRSRLPDWLVGIPTGREQARVIGTLELKAGDRVLDAACGPGFNLRRLVGAVGPEGLVVAAEENPHLLARAKEKVDRAGWENVRLAERLEDVEPALVDAIIVSYNPPIFQQREDLLRPAWEALRPGGRLGLVAGRCTTPAGRLFGPLVRASLWLFGHPQDWRYWTVHEPWKGLEALAGEVVVRPYLGFQYRLLAVKPGAS